MAPTTQTAKHSAGFHAPHASNLVVYPNLTLFSLAFHDEFKRHCPECGELRNLEYMTWQYT